MGTPNLNIPKELYRDIVVHLHHPEHRLTVLSLAMVNTTWRHESQRVLFRIIDVNWLSRPMQELDRDIHVRAHIHFLDIVLEDPTRLGAYVYSYEQKYAALEPIMRTSHRFVLRSN